MSSIFDALSIVTPCLLQPKGVVQQLWKQNIDWDEPIPNSLLKQWEFWKEDMQFISDINIPRWFGFEKQLGDRIELNIFCDASSEAYGAVAYVNYFYECLKKQIPSFFVIKTLSRPYQRKIPDNTPLRTASCCISNASQKHYFKIIRLLHR